MRTNSGHTLDDNYAHPVEAATSHTRERADTDEAAWSFKSTIAFWCGVLFMNGSFLFIVGAFYSLDGILPAGEGHENAERALVEYPYFIGAVFNFLPACYLVYFQIINGLAGHGSPNSEHEVQRTVFVVLPRRELGHMACLINVGGAACYAISTANMYCSGDYVYRWMMNIPAIAGSIMFMLGAVLEGEYNAWRACKRLDLWQLQLPVVQAYSYTLGATLFLWGYVAMWNHWSGANPLRADLWTNGPFLVGSAFFLIGSMCDLLMWKNKMYGLGFANNLSRHVRNATVDYRQFVMLVVYGILMCMAQVNIGIYIAIPKLHDKDLSHELPHFICELLIYSCIMLLASVIHTTPDRHPYNILLWAMRFIALIDLYAQVSTFVWLFENLGIIDGDNASHLKDIFRLPL